MLRIFLLILRAGFTAASLIVGTLLGAATIAGTFARWFDFQLPVLPETILGFYYAIRDLCFEWWTPGWWPPILSDSITLYIAMAFALFRGLTLEAELRPDKRMPIFARIGSSLIWPYLLFNPKSLINTVRVEYQEETSWNWWERFWEGLPKFRRRVVETSSIDWLKISVYYGTILVTGLLAVVLLYFEFLQNLLGL